MDIQPYRPTDDFPQIVSIIQHARENAYRKVNEELIMMYWHVGDYLSKALETAAYGDKFIDSLADFMAQTYPELKGFNRRGLYRMRQFYETYHDNEIVSALLTQLSWSSHLLILSGCKTMEERIFYMQMCIREKYNYRELRRQIDSGYYERYMLSSSPASPALAQLR